MDVLGENSEPLQTKQTNFIRVFILTLVQGVRIFTIEVCPYISNSKGIYKPFSFNI
jgi:hypothetical protein